MSSTTPWKDERWLPGVLNRNQIIALKNAYLLMDIDESTLGWDASALDLHLTSEGYKMIKGSIKPFNKSYKEILLDTSYAEPLPKGDDSFLLEKETCYIFKIKERLHHCIKSSPIYGQATAKSTFGRVDVIARLIVDGMKEYENFDPTEVDSGDMFIEITPITFNVKVRKGDSISQLRFFFGEIENSIIQDKDFIKSILHIPDGVFNDGTLSVDISNVFLNDGTPAAAFQAKEKVLTPIELWKKPEPERYPQNDFWNAIPSDEKDGLKSIQIKENKFYILRSKERIALTDGVCIYCRAID